jgi:hypothetical protein
MIVRSTLVAVSALALSALIVTSASARNYHHRYHRGHHAFAYAGHGPSGPMSLRFQNGSGWNNGRLDRRQYGRPDHW